MASGFGIVLRGVGGLYDVRGDDGRMIRCRPRGRIKLDSLTILAGDRVEYSIVDDHGGVIERVLPRKTVLLRPAVANIDQLVIVAACAQPDPQPLLIDRLLVLAESHGVHPVVCLNKLDLVSSSVPRDLAAIYEKADYEILFCSAKVGTGIEELGSFLKDKVTSLAGPSGAGKSSLVNALEPDLQLVTQEVSKKTGRGRQTTRHVELLELSAGGYVADTPGFSQLRLVGIDVLDLDSYFPDIWKWKGDCRFASCLHRGEPGCAVAAAADEGAIAPSRLESYRLFMEELEQERSKY